MKQTAMGSKGNNTSTSTSTSTGNYISNKMKHSSSFTVQQHGKNQLLTFVVVVFTAVAAVATVVSRTTTMTTMTSTSRTSTMNNNIPAFFFFVDAWSTSTGTGSTSRTVLKSVNGRYGRSQAFSRTMYPTSPSSRTLTSKGTFLFSTNKNDNDDDDDDDIEMFEAIKAISEKKNQQVMSMSSSMSSGSANANTNTINNNNNNKVQPKLGIDIGKMLNPLSEQEAAELRAAAIEIINDAYAEGVDEMQNLKKRMQEEIEQQRSKSQLKSELYTQLETEKLLNKIDTMTNKFLQETSASRIGTKLAAAADAEMALMKSGIEFGSWGTLDGITIATDSARTGANALLGSVQAAMQSTLNDPTTTSTSATTTTTTTSSPLTKRIIVIADDRQDNNAKQILQPLIDEMQSKIPDLDVVVYKPTSNIPFGGNGAQCVILFLTSLTDSNSIQTILDRLVRTTVIGSNIVQPPTQFIAISSIGTTRYNKMPYSVVNMMSGGKLEKRRQMEETLIKFVNTRTPSSSKDSGFDYTIAKFGEIKASAKEPFQFTPFDTIDGTTDIVTATKLLSQAIGYQPAARNSTFHCAGTIPTFQNANDNNDDEQNYFDDIFLKLYGPELYRTSISSNDVFVKSQTKQSSIDLYYDDIVEYVREWAFLLAESKKGLTTPIRAEVPKVTTSALPRHNTVVKQSSVQVLFLPTNTGWNYLSAEEEKKRRDMTDKDSGPSLPMPTRRGTIKEGGIEFVTELLSNGDIRLRARRCNYAYDAVVKELSEDTIISRFKKSIEVWRANHT